MQQKLKNSALALCLFVFLFVVIGGGFHLTPGAAFLAAVSGTPVVIYAFNRRCASKHHPQALFRNRQADDSNGLRKADLPARAIQEIGQRTL